MQHVHLNTGNDMHEIKVWAQMFFDDGSVTQGMRVPAKVLDNKLGEIRQIAVHLLGSVGRTEGLLLIWGAGNLFYNYYILDQIISSSSQDSESETSALEP